MTNRLKTFLGRKTGSGQAERDLEAAKAQIKQQRRELAQRGQRIQELESKLSAANARSTEVPEAQNSDQAADRREGVLPDFVVIGAMKGGTTFFYRMLSQHPSIRPAGRKEVQFFDLHFHRGVDWYKSHFTAPTSKEGRPSITGEATPYYLFHPSVAQRMARVIPEARVIVLLRDPVDRALSHYNHTARAGHEDLPFEQAVELEELRLRGEREKISEEGRYNSFNHRWFSYLARGVYVDQISAWAEVFGRERMLVMKSEDFFSNRAAALDRTLKFLDLPPWDFQNRRPREKSRAERRYQPMSATTRECLEEYFEPHNRRLCEYLDKDFGW